MPVPLDGVFFASPLLVVGLIRVFRLHQALADNVVSVFWLALITVVFFFYEWCMGRA